MIHIGDALLKLGVDSTGLEKGLDKVSKRMDDMGKKMQKTGAIMMAAGAAIVGALVGITMKTAQAGDEIAKMSKRTGFGTVALSELRHAANLSGSSLEGLETGIKRMSRVLVDATEGLETANRPLERLGLNVEDLMALSPEEQFYTLARAIAELEDPTLRAATAQEIFGRAGTDLLPMLSDGAEGLEKMRQEAHELGVVFDEEAAKAAEAFNDAITRLKASFASAGKEIAEVLMPILTDLLENKIIPIIQKITDWIEKNEGLVKTLLAIGTMLVVGGAILVGLGSVFRAIMAINAGLAIMHGLAGPAGWIKLAAGIAIAAGAIAGISALVKGMEVPEIPSAQHGAIVTRPTLLQAGEAGPEAIVPLPSAFGSKTVNVSLGLLPGDDVTLRNFVRKLREVLGEDSRRNTFGQVNQGYFYGRSSI